jgi:hypothetical protein
MRWVTRDYVHADRVASPWLIKRFVDPEAEFVFVPWGCEDQRPADAIPFALPGAELGPHDASGSTFRKVLVKYGLEESALHAMARIVEAAIAFVLHGVEPQTLETKPAIGLLTISEGTMLLEDDDGHHCPEHADVRRHLRVFDRTRARADRRTTPAGGRRKGPDAVDDVLA